MGGKTIKSGTVICEREREKDRGRPENLPRLWLHTAMPSS
jgi:hypothetical protein